MFFDAPACAARLSLGNLPLRELAMDVAFVSIQVDSVYREGADLISPPMGGDFGRSLILEYSLECCVGWRCSTTGCDSQFLEAFRFVRGAFLFACLLGNGSASQIVRNTKRQRFQLPS